MYARSGNQTTFKGSKRIIMWTLGAFAMLALSNVIMEELLTSLRLRFHI